jgi:hypothetical protein
VSSSSAAASTLPATPISRVGRSPICPDKTVGKGANRLRSLADWRQRSIVLLIARRFPSVLNYSL